MQIDLLPLFDKIRRQRDAELLNEHSLSSRAMRITDGGDSLNLKTKNHLSRNIKNASNSKLDRYRKTIQTNIRNRMVHT